MLANNALVSLVSSIPGMDNHGERRMSLNVLVLQQILKQLQPEADLHKAAYFYELGSQGPEVVVSQGPKAKEGFSVDDLKALVRLSWREERDGPVEGGEGVGVEGMQARLGGGGAFPARKSSLKGRGRGRGRPERTLTGE